MSNKVIEKKACAIILAGGKGTRIRNIHPDTPKPMISVCGLPFIEWVIRYFSSQGIKNHVISLGHLAQVAQDYFEQREKDDNSISTIVEETVMGTGGAFLFAKEKTAGFDSFILANGDSIVLADLSLAWELFQEKDVDAVIVGILMSDTSRYGTLDIDNNGFLKGFREKQPGEGIINAGIYFIKDRIINLFPEKVPLSMEMDVIPKLLNSNVKVKAAVCKAPFIDIGTPESLKEAEKFITDNFKKGDRN